MWNIDFNDTGLSPLARGTYELNRILLDGDWFIPTYAGKTTGRMTAGKAVSICPRWRREL